MCFCKDLDFYSNPAKSECFREITITRNSICPGEYTRPSVRVLPSGASAAAASTACAGAFALPSTTAGGSCEEAPYEPPDAAPRVLEPDAKVELTNNCNLEWLFTKILRRGGGVGVEVYCLSEAFRPTEEILVNACRKRTSDFLKHSGCGTRSDGA